jgi:hypothetical protein
LLLGLRSGIIKHLSQHWENSALLTRNSLPTFETIRQNGSFGIVGAVLTFLTLAPTWQALSGGHINGLVSKAVKVWIVHLERSIDEGRDTNCWLGHSVHYLPSDGNVDAAVTFADY